MADAAKNRSPIQSPSPKRRRSESSPRARKLSLTHERHSPLRKGSLSPKVRASPSPLRKGSASPPKRGSLSPRRYSPSPVPHSRTPEKKTSSRERYSRSPGRRRSRSPQRRYLTHFYTNVCVWTPEDSLLLKRLLASLVFMRILGIMLQ